jgi:hypothetical protein
MINENTPILDGKEFLKQLTEKWDQKITLNNIYITFKFSDGSTKTCHLYDFECKVSNFVITTLQESSEHPHSEE